MCKKLLSSLALFALAACSTNPHKAKNLDTSLENKTEVVNESIGVKDGNMIVQKKVLMAEELRSLQFSVYELEDHVYGSREFGSRGIYGVLKDCKMKLAEKANGGDGKLSWMEPLDRITDKEDKLEIGLDDRKQLVGLQEEFLKDRIARFQQYKDILMKREDDLNQKVDICRTELKSRQYEMAKGQDL